MKKDVKILDEFTDLPITRQRKQQLRHRRDKKCKQCGGPLDGKIYCTQHRLASSERNRQIPRDKKEAHYTVTRALVSGKIVRQKCWCGELGQAHHEDYSKPLDITWLCHRHHLERHGKKAFADYKIKNLNPTTYHKLYNAQKRAQKNV